MALRSEEVNYLIYRYLQESGFDHSAFTFAYESSIADMRFFDSYVVPGTLITLLQKALQYIELEAHVRDDGSEVDCVAPFSLLHSHTCRTKKKDDHEVDMGDIEGIAKDIVPSQVASLPGHSSRVNACRWSKSGNMLLTGGEDGTARIWSVPEVTKIDSSLSFASQSIESVVVSGPVKANSPMDVSSIDWSFDSSLVVVASFNGTAYVTPTSSVFKQPPASNLLGDASVTSDAMVPSSSSSTLSASISSEVSGPCSPLLLCTYPSLIMTASFAPTTPRVLITGLNNSFHLYDLGAFPKYSLETDTASINELATKKGGSISIPTLSSPTSECIQQAVWRDDNCIAFSDSGNYVTIVNLQSDNGNKRVLQRIQASKSDINAIEWVCNKSVLVSTGEDAVIRIWSDMKDSVEGEFFDHLARVNGLCSSTYNSQWFASCSDDKTVRLYDVSAMRCHTVLPHHNSAVRQVQWGPNGSKLVASSSGDNSVILSDSTTGEIVKSWKSQSLVFDLRFSSSGTELAVATQDPHVFVLDVRVL